MILKTLFFITVMAFALASCEKEKMNPDETRFAYFTFGRFYGECVGEGCIEIFRLENNKLLEDTTDQYPGTVSPVIGSYVELPHSKYEQVKDIVDAIPDQLMQDTAHVIGIPDGGDWGGIYIEVRTTGDFPFTRFWLLDQNENNMPQVYNDFVDEVNKKLAFIAN